MASVCAVIRSGKVSQGPSPSGKERSLMGTDCSKTVLALVKLYAGQTDPLRVGAMSGRSRQHLPLGRASSVNGRWDAV
jgi:hypothetical protein